MTDTLTFPEATVREFIADGVIVGGRPLGLVTRHLYQRQVSQGVFPHDARTTVISGDDPIHLMFVGSVAVAGYGVLNHGMTTASRTAAMTADALHRGCRWSEVSAPTLTAHRAAAYPGDFSKDVQVAVVLLGITDALALTPVQLWTWQLETLKNRIQASAGPGVHLIFGGIPPLTAFTRVSKTTAMILDRQVARLNAATIDVAGDMPRAVFVPFPPWPVSSGKNAMSWRQLHITWAAALTPHLVALLTSDS